jgi:hypothetical protein
MFSQIAATLFPKGEIEAMEVMAIFEFNFLFVLDYKGRKVFS